MSFFFKAAGGTVFLSVASIVGTAAIKPGWFSSMFSLETLMFGVSEEVTDASFEESDEIETGSTSEKNKNYSCKFAEITPSVTFDCTISEPKLEETKKQTTKYALLEDKETQNLTKSKLKTADKIFKITTATSNLKDKDKIVKTIEIVKAAVGTTINSSNTQKYASIKVLFTIKNINPQVKTGYFVWKTATKIEAKLAPKDNKYACYLSKEPTKLIECKIYDFASVETGTNSSKEFNDLDFQLPETTSTKITHNKLFVFK